MSKLVLNKGVVSGVSTILSGAVAVLVATGITPPGLLVALISLLGTFGGVFTTKDSIELRQK